MHLSRLFPLIALLISTAVLAAGLPVRKGDVFVLPDGTRVRALAPDGHSGSTARDGSIHYPDGTVVSQDPRTGETQLKHADGRVERLPRTAPRASGAGFGFAFPDGTRLRSTGPSGKPARMSPDGSVLYPDGTRATHDAHSGETRFVAPDGTERRINRRKGTDNTARTLSAAPAGSGPAKPASADPRYAGALLRLPADALVRAPDDTAAPHAIDPFATRRQ